MPNRLVEAEVAHAGLTKLHIVETMHERKALMSELWDESVVASPGEAHRHAQRAVRAAPPGASSACTGCRSAC